MIASTFIKELRILKPQIESDDEGMIAFFQKGFNIPIIESRKNIFNNEIENLCLNYLEKDLVMGAISIFSRITIYEDYKVFGSFEAGTLVFTDEKQISVLGHEDGNLLMLVSKDDKAFLSAFLVFAELMKGRIEDKFDSRDINLNKDFARRCSVIAGGEKYYNFFAALIGYC